MDDIPKDKYCSPNVDIANCNAFYVHLEPMGDERTAFMFWRGDKPPAGFRCWKRSIRSLRPGDPVVYNGKRRVVASVMIYR